MGPPQLNQEENRIMGHEVTRREFLKVSGAVAATAGAAGMAVPATAEARAAGAAGYPARAVGKAGGMKVNAPVAFTYPDAASPCTAVKLGKAVPGGVGPGGDIVAYSNLCTHMGCPVSYDADARTFKCPCHFSVFDAELSGQMICGQATENLPRVQLAWNEKDDSVTAIGVIGLIYGRVSNIL
jgi:arsenite oxidase small subunit